MLIGDDKILIYFMIIGVLLKRFILLFYDESSQKKGKMLFLYLIKWFSLNQKNLNLPLEGSKVAEFLKGIRVNFASFSFLGEYVFF